MEFTDGEDIVLDIFDDPAPPPPPPEAELELQDVVQQQNSNAAVELDTPYRLPVYVVRYLLLSAGTLNQEYCLYTMFFYRIGRD